MTASSAYYSRESITHVDGTRIFQTPEDRARESAVAARLAGIWKCEVLHFGALSPIDWYATRDNRITGLLELKDRGHSSDKYPTVFLSVRKWLALQLGNIGFGKPAAFVVQFTDGIWWVRLANVDPRRIRMGGCTRRRAVTSESDWEPIIEVQIQSMRKLA